MKDLLLTLLTVVLVSGLMAQPKDNSPRPIHLIDRQLSLSGVFGDDATQSFIGLDGGDKILLNCIRLSKKGTASISIRDLNRENEIYKMDVFDTIRDASIHVPAKGIYVVSLKTGSLLGKDVRLMLDRVPAAGATASGQTATGPKSGNDTTSVEVLNTITTVYSKNSPRSANTVLAVKLPPNTTYWVMWIGAGRESLQKIKDFSASCLTIGSLYPSDPLVLYGRKFISALPMTSTNAKISYHFLDSHNTNAFMNNQQYSSYMFKSSQKITTEYAFIPNHQDDLNLGISNESSSSSQDVAVRVVAFIVKGK